MRDYEFPEGVEVIWKQNEEPAPLGDINGDNKVNIQDVIRLLNHVNNSDRLADTSGCDINGDGKVNIQDVIRLLNHVNNSDRLY